MKLIGKEPRNKDLNDLVKERTNEISELEEKTDYEQQMFVTAAETFYDFHNYRKPILLFHDIRN